MIEFSCMSCYCYLTFFKKEIILKLAGKAKEFQAENYFIYRPEVNVCVYSVGMSLLLWLFSFRALVLFMFLTIFTKYLVL